MAHQINIAHQDDSTLSFVARFMWLCPILGLAAATVLLRMFGANWWIAALIAFALACPSVIAWALYAEVSRPGKALK